MPTFLAPMEIFATFLQLFKHVQYKDVYFIAPALTSIGIALGLIIFRHLLTKGVKRKSRTILDHTMRVMDWGSTLALIFAVGLLSTFGYISALISASIAVTGCLIFYLHKEAKRLDWTSKRRDEDSAKVGIAEHHHDFSITLIHLLSQSLLILRTQSVRRTAIFLTIAICAFIFSSSDICIPDEPNELHMSTRLTRWLRGDACHGPEPCFVYLTAPENLSSSVIVHFHTNSEPKSCVVKFGTESERLLQSTTGFRIRVPIEVSRYVCHVQLVNLQPDVVYYFTATADSRHFSTLRKVRTASSDPRESIHVVAGGDMGAYVNTVKLTDIAAASEPVAALIGGDLGYDEGFYSCYPRWDWWLKLVHEHLVTPSGFTIPMIVAIGNHDGGGYGLDAEESPFYYAYFAQESNLTSTPIFNRKSYHYHILGGNTLLLSLDSGITASETGEQSEWIQSTFRKYSFLANRLALYHVPLYPSRRSPTNENTKRVKSAWRSLFDQHHLTVALENHDHAYKRTHLLKNDTIDPSGTLYIGDGSWGVPATKPVLRWYDEKIAATGFVLRIYLERDTIKILSVDEKGEIFDSWSK